MDVDDILSKYSSTEGEEGKEKTPEVQEKKEFIKRKPSEWRMISDIKKEDGRVRVVGVVTELDKETGIFSIDDGMTMTLVSTPEQIKDLRVGQKVCILGMVVPFSQNVEIRVEVIQDFDKIDMVLYRKFMEFIKNRGGLNV